MHSNEWSLCSEWVSRQHRVHLQLAMHNWLQWRCHHRSPVNLRVLFLVQLSHHNSADKIEWKTNESQYGNDCINMVTALHVVSANNIQTERRLGRPLVLREHSFVTLLQNHVHGLIKPLQTSLLHYTHCCVRVKKQQGKLQGKRRNHQSYHDVASIAGDDANRL